MDLVEQFGLLCLGGLVCPLPEGNAVKKLLLEEKLRFRRRFDVLSDFQDILWYLVRARSPSREKSPAYL